MNELFNQDEFIQGLCLRILHVYEKPIESQNNLVMKEGGMNAVCFF